MSESPRITPELLITLAFVEAKRLKQNNATWCRKHFVGKARKLLGRGVIDNVVPLTESEAHFQPQRDAQMALKALCVRCAGCEMAKE